MNEEVIDVNEVKNRILLARRANEVVALYVDRTDWGSCSVGRVLAVDDTFVALRGLEKSGKDDAIVLRKLAEIFRIDVATEYEKKIASLSEARSLDFELPDSKLLRRVLEVGKSRSSLVTLWGDDPEDSFEGYVDALGNEVITMLASRDDISDCEQSPGVTIFRFDALTAVDVDISSCQRKAQEKTKDMRPSSVEK